MNSSNNNKRWGSDSEDHRDWKTYNEELVVRGKFYLGLGFSEHWDEELKEMNKGKRGAPYKFPDSFINLMVAWHQLIDYRGLEGYCKNARRIQYNTIFWSLYNTLYPYS